MRNLISIHVFLHCTNNQGCHLQLSIQPFWPECHFPLLFLICSTVPASDFLQDEPMNKVPYVLSIWRWCHFCSFMKCIVCNVWGCFVPKHMNPHAVFDEVLLKIVISVPKESQMVSMVLSDGERIEHFLYAFYNSYPFFPKAYQNT